MVYNYPEQVQNNPNIAQNFQHIIPSQEAGAIPQTPPLSLMSSNSSGIQSSLVKVTKVLRNKTIQTNFPQIRNMDSKRIGKNQKPSWTQKQNKTNKKTKQPNGNIHWPQN